MRHRAALKQCIHATLIAHGLSRPVSDLFGLCRRELLERFAAPRKLIGYTGLCPLVHQSGACDRRGPLAKNGPEPLRRALIEAAVHAARHPAYVVPNEATKKRLGRQRGAKVARVEVARQLAVRRAEATA
ncbi:MAG: IS110 family transposase [Actinobacteria bacterium]|nr:IS110 family transposase [Actinomycetota bacterium]